MRDLTGGRACSRRLLLAALAVVALWSAPSSLARAVEPSPAAMPAGLARALDAYNRATIRNDTATLAGLVTDDYLLVNSDATTQGKRSYLADFAAPGFRIDPYTIEQPIWRVHGDAAMTGGIVPLSWTQDGRHQSRRLRIVHFWVRQDRRWRIAYTQLTRIPN